MPRVKRGVGHVKHRNKILKQTKGFHWGRKNKLKLAKPAILKAGVYAFRDRRVKKRVFRALWLTKLNAALRTHGVTYSRFMGGLKKNKIDLNRKVLAELAEQHPKVLEALIKHLT